MRTTGIVLVIVGILMLVFNGINYQQEKKVVDLGPLQINKKENKHIGWPMYVGGVVVLAGIVLVVVGDKKR